MNVAMLIRARSCERCRELTPSCEFLNYGGRCEDCWVEAFILSFDWSIHDYTPLAEVTPMLLTERERELMFGGLIL